MTARHIYIGRDWTRPDASHSRRESAQYASWEQPRRIAINRRELAGTLVLIIIAIFIYVAGGK